MGFAMTATAEASAVSRHNGTEGRMARDGAAPQVWSRGTHSSRWFIIATCGALLGVLGCSDDALMIGDQSPAKPDRAPGSQGTTASGDGDGDAAGADGVAVGGTEGESAAGSGGGAKPIETSNAGAAAVNGSKGMAGAGGSAGAGNGGAGGSISIPPADGGVPPVLVNPVALDDATLGPAALALMGSSVVGATGSCSSCHALGRPTLTRWKQLTSSFRDDCLVDPSLAGQAAVDATYACFEGHASSAAGFAPRDFGIFAAAAHLPWFSYVFQHATPTAANGAALHEQFVAHVGMPRAGEPWTQAEFDQVAEWFARGLPGLSELVPEDSNEAGCVATIDPKLTAHIADMQAAGWRAQNATVPLLMFGCADGQTGAACLGTMPAAAAQPYGIGWDQLPGTTIRILRDNSASPTTYWSRSSPDGRFIASGLAGQAPQDLAGQIVDLQRNVVIPGSFSYDATFFPDNSGFMVQRGIYATPTPGGLPTNGTAGATDEAVICQQSVLLSNPATFTGQEPLCTSLAGQIGLYEQLARSVDGDDYWVVFGAYGEDDGGFRNVLDNPAAAFETQSTTTLVPMINQGTRFEPGAPVQVSTPLQGDPMLSPSGRLLITRVKGEERDVIVDGSDVVTAEQSGYALHLVTTAHTGSAYSASLEEVGRLCINGGKAVLSFDERWMVLHHYVTAADAVELGFTGPEDPAFADYATLGASNLYLVDLLSGQAQRITNMQPGQYALFPHFRSDGWIYFVVRTLDVHEYFAASDAALVSEAAAAPAAP
jgi:hypothetical protein